jgi:hypothetical protein
MTPLLKAYKDTDQHEPKPLYRLFERIIPSQADKLDRELSLIRLTNGELLRAKVEPFQLGSTAWSNIRVFAVRQKKITRRVDVHSLRHSTQIEYFDTAILFTAASKATATATGFTRLSQARIIRPIWSMATPSAPSSAVFNPPAKFSFSASPGPPNQPRTASFS